jgi:heme-degrading monooxygenase HmoA
MILETAFIYVTPGQVDEFVAALPEARKILQQAEGFESLTYQRGIEQPNTVLLTIRWATLEDHTEKFRGGDLFPQWRAVIGPFFASAPLVEHWQITD